MKLLFITLCCSIVSGAKMTHVECAVECSTLPSCTGVLVDSTVNTQNACILRLNNSTTQEETANSYLLFTKEVSDSSHTVVSYWHVTEYKRKEDNDSGLRKTSPEYKWNCSTSYGSVTLSKQHVYVIKHERTCIMKAYDTKQMNGTFVDIVQIRCEGIKNVFIESTRCMFYVLFTKKHNSLLRQIFFTGYYTDVARRLPFEDVYVDWGHMHLYYLVQQGKSNWLKTLKLDSPSDDICEKTVASLKYKACGLSFAGHRSSHSLLYYSCRHLEKREFAIEVFLMKYENTGYIIPRPIWNFTVVGNMATSFVTHEMIAVVYSNMTLIFHNIWNSSKRQVHICPWQYNTSFPILRVLVNEVCVVCRGAHEQQLYFFDSHGYLLREIHMPLFRDTYFSET